MKKIMIVIVIGLFSSCVTLQPATTKPCDVMPCDGSMINYSDLLFTNKDSASSFDYVEYSLVKTVGNFKHSVVYSNKTIGSIIFELTDQFNIDDRSFFVSYRINIDRRDGYSYIYRISDIKFRDYAYKGNLYAREYMPIYNLAVNDYYGFGDRIIRKTDSSITFFIKAFLIHFVTTGK